MDASSRIRAKASISSRTVCGPEGVADLGAVDRDLGDAGAGVLVADVLVVDDGRPGDGRGHAAGTSCRKSMTRRRKARGRSRWGVWPTPSRSSRRAPGMPAATGLGAGAADGVEGAGDHERRGRDGGEAVVERLHRALAGAPEAGGEAARVVARGGSRAGARRRPGPGRRGVAKTGLRSQLVDERPRCRRARCGRPGPRRRRGAPRARPGPRCPADGLSRTRRSDGRRVGDGEPERDPGAQRVAEDVRGQRRPGARRIAARSSAVALDGHARGVRGAAIRPWPGQVRRR